MTTRMACMFLLLWPEDCSPPHGLDLVFGSRDDAKVRKLQKAFEANGFDRDEPAIVGYPLDGKVQLLTGTHRREAALRAGIKIPVRLVLRSIVEASWGTDKWDELVKDIPVKDLEWAPVGDPVPPPGIDERVDLTKGYEE